MASIAGRKCNAQQIFRGAHNAWLAARRAQEVKLFMESRLRNFSPQVIIAAGPAGSANPLVNDCSGLAMQERIKCEAPNRRVEIEIIRKQPVIPE